MTFVRVFTNASDGEICWHILGLQPYDY